MADSEAAISNYWIETLKLWRTVLLKCRNGHYYHEIDNLGRHRCKQHASPFNQSTQEWPCCNNAQFFSNGCVPADHNVHTFNYTETHDIHLPSQVIANVLQDGPGLVKKTIRRFDKEIQDEKNPYWADGYSRKYIKKISAARADNPRSIYI